MMDEQRKIELQEEAEMLIERFLSRNGINEQAYDEVAENAEEREYLATCIVSVTVD